MTVRKLLAGKPDDVSVIRPDVRVQDVIDELDELDDPNQQQTMQGPAHARAD